MRIIDCEQNTPEWVEARIGIPTASEFNRILTSRFRTGWRAPDGSIYRTQALAKEAGWKPKELTKTEPVFELELGPGAVSYANELIAERLVGPAISGESRWTERGRILESEARDLFMFLTDKPIEQIGFIVDDDLQIGCSPDGVIRDGEAIVTGLEVKCPKAATHVEYLVSGEVPEEYIPQVQGSMLVTGASEWWFMSYHPEIDPLILRVAADTEWQQALRAEVAKFNALIDERMQRITELQTERQAA